MRAIFLKQVQGNSKRMWKHNKESIYIEYVANKGTVKKKNSPPEKFYPRIKFFNDCAKRICPTLKILSAQPGHV